MSCATGSRRRMLAIIVVTVVAAFFYKDMIDFITKPILDSVGCVDVEQLASRGTVQPLRADHHQRSALALHASR